MTETSLSVRPKVAARSFSVSPEVPRQLSGLVFVLPLLLSLAVMLVYPTLWLVALALSESTLGRPLQAWVGLDQFVAAATDPAFQSALLRSIAFAVPVSLAEVGLGVAVALLIHRLAKLGRVLAVVILLPLITPPVMVAIAWKLMLAPSGGLVNGWLLSAGVIDQPISFLGTATLAWSAVALADAWQWTPFMALLTYAALTALPQEVLEAARLDCPRAWDRFVHVTLPLLAPTLAALFLMKLVISLKLFDLVYVLTFGGPGDATTVAAFQIWRTGLEQFDVGTASAQTLIFGLVAGVVTLPAVWLHRAATGRET